jgi:hypothetical protein
MKDALRDEGASKVVWRGQAGDTANPAPHDIARTIDGAIDKLFQHFPPGKR